VNALRTAGELWRKLSAREQRLAALILALAAVLVCVVALRRAWDRIEELDSAIMLMEDAIIESAHQISRREAVEAEYGEVAAQHSSAWSAAEILDRLRNEMYRLAYNVPSPLNEAGVADRVENDSGLLVNLPELGEGVLEDSEEGFREYRIGVRISNVPLHALINYLERLQASPQSLRVDALEMKRNFLDDKVTADIQITRIVVDRTEAPWTYFARQPEQWVNKGCQITAASHAALGSEGVVRVRASGPKGACYVPVTLEDGGAYELEFRAVAQGAATVRVYDERAGRNFEGEAQLSGDGGPHGYRIEFAVPAQAGPFTVRMPFLTLETPDSEVLLGGIAYRRKM